MNAHEIMKDLSRKHKSLPEATLSAAVTMRDELAPLMLNELNRLLVTFDANLDAPTEKEFIAKMRQTLQKPSPLFYGFFLAAEWKLKEAFRPFMKLIVWPEAAAKNLLSDEIVYEELVSRLLAEFYDGDPNSLFELLMDPNASDGIRFRQWRTLIRIAIKNQIDLGALRSLLTRAFNELEREPDLLVWDGWESVIIYFGLEDFVPLVERAHAEKRMQLERTIDHFHRDWDYARAHPESPFGAPHPESPFGTDPIDFYRGLTEEIGPAFGNRWRCWRFRWSRGDDHPIKWAYDHGAWRFHQPVRAHGLRLVTTSTSP
jgi:Protein of unknown function (DUF1186)